MSAHLEPDEEPTWRTFTALRQGWRTLRTRVADRAAARVERLDRAPGPQPPTRWRAGSSSGSSA
ncbi:MAG: hypothetical protein R3F43_32945 [bacterium]